MALKIDSHQHFWQLSRGDYTWLTPQYEKLYRDFLPHEIKPHLQKCNIDGTVLVQAASTPEETLFMLKLADQFDFIFGVVGWVDMEAMDASQKIEMLSMHEKFCGIRPMLQDIPDVNWMLQDNLIPAFKALENFNLTFDALVFPKHLKSLLQLVERFPNLKIVIDHGGKPDIKSKQYQPWAEHIKELATFPNVYCKLSGLLNEASENTSLDELKPFMNHLFLSFGAERLMWGSDYPVLNIVSKYEYWFNLCYQFIKEIDRESVENVFGQTAYDFYLKFI